MPGARMNSPFARSSRRTRAFALPIVFLPCCALRRSAHFGEREIAIATTAVVLRPRARDGRAAIIARAHRGGRRHADLVLRREDAGHRDLRSIDADADRMIAARARRRARPDPRSRPTGDIHLQIDGEASAVLGRRTGVGALPQAVRPGLRRYRRGRGSSGLRRRGCSGRRRCGFGGGVGLGLLSLDLLPGLFLLLLFFVEARHGGARLAQQRLVLHAGEIAGRRIVVRLLPRGDHLARAAAEGAVGTVGDETERRQRHLHVLTIERREPQGILRGLRRLLLVLFRLAPGGCFGLDLLPRLVLQPLFLGGFGLRLLPCPFLLALFRGHLGFDLASGLFLDLAALGGFLRGLLAGGRFSAQPREFLLILQALRLRRELGVLRRLVDDGHGWRLLVADQAIDSARDQQQEGGRRADPQSRPMFPGRWRRGGGRGNRRRRRQRGRLA